MERDILSQNAKNYEVFSMCTTSMIFAVSEWFGGVCGFDRRYSSKQKEQSITKGMILWVL